MQWLSVDHYRPAEYDEDRRDGFTRGRSADRPDCATCHPAVSLPWNELTRLAATGEDVSPAVRGYLTAACRGRATSPETRAWLAAWLLVAYSDAMTMITTDAAGMPREEHA